MKLAVIGAGRIVDFHLPALREAGFELAAIAARPNSSNAQNVARKFDIPLVFGTTQDMFNQIHHFDALLIASSSESHLDYLKHVAKLKMPVLIEKPVFADFKANSLLPDYGHSSDYIMVGYNRRFYPSVNSLKEKIDESKGGHLSINVPELSGTLTPNLEEILNCLKLNTVHIFDLLHYLFPIQDFSKTIYLHGDPGYFLSIHVVLQNTSFIIDINLTFGAPGNYKFEFRSGTHLATLNPIERFNEFNGMLILEPTAENPVRTYTPNPVSTLDSTGSLFKPGFLEQAKHFFNLANNHPAPGHATIQDAYNVSLFVDELIKRIHDRS
jgi:predicted dehydrogenase